jgi:hypothetical protein
MKLPFLAIALICSLASCALPSEISQELEAISPGDSYQSVIAKLGSPESFEERDGVLEIEYCNLGWITDETVKIGFKEDKVLFLDKGAPCGPEIYIPTFDTQPVTAALPPKLMIFGGKNNTVFLGCATCSELDSSSISNQFGSFGSSFSSTSIFNNSSEYGSRYGTYSVCNLNAPYPPVIVDNEGQFYAHLSLNLAKQNIRANRSSTVTELYRWLEEEVCD